MIQVKKISNLLIATHNPGKAREISDLLKPYIKNFYTAADLNLPEPEETETTFIGNAILKAKTAAIASGKTALADDSGLSVNALNGDPGIYSARWAGPDKDFNIAMKRVNDELGNAQDRSASFICVLALCDPDGNCKTFEGKIDGKIVWPPRGNSGFGYDPIFVADGYDITFGEMEPEEKHKISHRARAFEKMITSLK